MATISLTRIKGVLHSIRWKILISYLLIILIAFTAVAVSLIQLVGDYLFNQRIRDDQRIAESLSGQIGGALVELHMDEVQSIVRSAAEESAGRVLVVDNYGVVQIDTQSTLTGTRLANAEIASVLSGSDSDYGFYDLGSVDGFWIRAAVTGYSSVGAMSAFYAKAVYDGSARIGVLAYVSTVQEIYENLRSIQFKIIIWLLLVGALALLFSLLVTRMFTRPIGELSEGIRRMTGGDLSTRVNVSGHNEFTDLAMAFNSMSEKIEALDKTRSQFVSNASHELKTPLSTMKILIETLLYQDPIDPAMTKDFLTDVNKEIDRLNRIVSDLLTLVNIDSGGTKLNLTDMSISALLEEQVKRLLPLARENGIEINLNARDDIHVTGDATKLQQVIYNVIDNAIKYTPRGGEVTITQTRAGRRVIVRIADTGIGIPADDLPHIFDRFYRVDKARSRATGGTGLGLSIVKQIVQAHGGTITAESVEGKGTTFIIELPIQANA